MDTNPIQRLAYFNGQRLEAVDLQLEQHYHIAVRRILTRGLFTPGVVSGFDIQGKTGDTAVTVKAGVALDPCGREIIQVDDQTLAVPNTPPPMSLGGYFLTVAYAELDLLGGNGWCPPSSPNATARIQEGGILDWTPTLPAPMNCSVDSPKDCAIVLAFVAISKCTVQSIVLTPRQYATPAHTSQTQAFALEGEKDIDSYNPKRLYFQIAGGPPQAMTLYLWGDAFSSLYYTELGIHDHTLTAVPTGPPDVTHTHNMPHTHDVSGSMSTTTGAGSAHHHSIWTQPGQTFPLGGTHIALTNIGGHGEYDEIGQGGSGNYISDEATHTHTVSGSVAGSTGQPSQTATAGDNAPHKHSVTGATDTTGTDSAPQARTGNAYTYLANLVVKLDDTDITAAILAHQPGMTSLGDGTGPFNTNVPIDLLAVAAGQQIPMNPGTHHLDFMVAQGNGGKVLYNLYVR